MEKEEIPQRMGETAQNGVDTQDILHVLGEFNKVAETLKELMQFCYSVNEACRSGTGPSYTRNENHQCIVISGGTNDVRVTFENGKIETNMEPKTEDAIVVNENIKKSNDFESYIPNNFDKCLIMKRLHDLIDGKQAADAVKVIIGGIEGGVLLRVPTYTQMTNEFGAVCTKSGFYQLTKKQFFDNELRPIINYLKA